MPPRRPPIEQAGETTVAVDNDRIVCKPRLWYADARAGDLPACLSLITGPSKTGDIELRLVTGVHGPGEVHVILINP